MIIDNVIIKVEAGAGGNGSVSFRKEKFIPRGGPDGGNGGNGGSIYFESVSDISALRYFRYRKEIKADRGGHGGAKKMHGANAADLTIPVPVGTTVTNLDTGYVWNFDEIGIRKRIARGGRGGLGNFEFRSSTNQAPRTAEPGRPGAQARLQLDMKFIADIGLIGLPSAGKSSLLNALTKADAKVGAYPFTTLEPNLGAFGRKIIADIPGLIEGAHAGKGLGDRFLKHIEKTKVLVHCIDAQSDDCVRDYRVVRRELEQYNPALLQKEEIILLTKSDLVDEKILAAWSKKLARYAMVLPVSVIDDEQLKKLHTVLRGV